MPTPDDLRILSPAETGRMLDRFEADFASAFGELLDARNRDFHRTSLARLDHPSGCVWCRDEATPGCSECDPVAREESRGAFRRGL